MLDGKASGGSTDSGHGTACRRCGNVAAPSESGRKRERSWASIKVPGYGCWRIR